MTLSIMRKTLPTPPSSSSPRIAHDVSLAIVCSSYYEDLIASMEETARRILLAAGARTELLRTIYAPGAFELPLACQHLAEKDSVDGIIAFGVIVQGETHHAAEIARGCTDGIMQVQLAHSVPIVHAVLFVDSLAQARARCLGKANKGGEAARTLIQMLALLAEMP